MTTIQTACVKYLMEIDNKNVKTLFVNSGKHNGREWGGGNLKIFVSKNLM
jgi:hypothetical protein